jgi:hypothetical protein
MPRSSMLFVRAPAPCSERGGRITGGPQARPRLRDHSGLQYTTHFGGHQKCTCLRGLLPSSTSGISSEHQCRSAKAHPACGIIQFTEARAEGVNTTINAAADTPMKQFSMSDASRAWLTYRPSPQEEVQLQYRNAKVLTRLFREAPRRMTSLSRSQNPCGLFMNSAARCNTNGGRLGSTKQACTAILLQLSRSRGLRPRAYSLARTADAL